MARDLATRIALFDISPAFRRGLAALLRDAGLHPVELDRLETPESRGLPLIAALDGCLSLDELAVVVQRRPQAPVVALLAGYDEGTATAALRLGVTSVCHRNDTEEDILAVVQQALRGRSLLPTSLARHLATSAEDALGSPEGLSLEETEMVRRLAASQTITTIATHMGISERTLYRRLDQAFTRIGVGSRMEAVAWASRNGLLEV